MERNLSILEREKKKNVIIVIEERYVKMDAVLAWI